MPRIKRALISVFDKTGIAELALKLHEFDVEIISTGGTAQHLQEHRVPTISVSSVTNFPEILSGRVKTLHPVIFGGLLAVRENPIQMDEVREHKIDSIDLVIVSLYPFEEIVSQNGATLAKALENIDIGGPSLVRAAAKNYTAVTVLTSPRQYDSFLSEFSRYDGETTLEFRKKLAAAAFARTSHYDSFIEKYLTEEAQNQDDRVDLHLTKALDLRYGENPHQNAGFYMPPDSDGRLPFEQLQGRELSYNNLLDLDAAAGIVNEFEDPCCSIVKHSNPCGVATAQDLQTAYVNAKATDPISAFGGIVSFNRLVDAKTASLVSEIFTEVVVAPGFSDEAIAIFSQKKNLRLVTLTKNVTSYDDIRSAAGGFLIQENDTFELSDSTLQVVSKRQPSSDELAAMKFGWRVCKWVKSNAIVYSQPDRTIGIGAGQMSRVDSSQIAADKAKRIGLNLSGTALASDAFFPFRDGVDVAAQVGAAAIIQPGGSVRDEEVIAAADDHSMAMIFTGIRHFRH